MEKTTYDYVDDNYLVTAGALFKAVKYRSYELLGAIVGGKVLDIGCGAGIDTLALGALVGERGKVVGVDHDVAMIARANQRTREQGMAERIKHYTADAGQLPFMDNDFDAVRSERLFIHLRDPVAVLAEAVRVTRPLGNIVVVDTDWGSLSTETGTTDIERRLTQFCADEVFANGYSGRRLYGLMTAAGLCDVTLAPMALHLTDLALWRFVTQFDRVEKLALQRQVISDIELKRWHNNLQSTSGKKAFFGSVTIIIAIGQKPQSESA